MKLLFLDRNTLSYKDNAFVGTQYEIVLDQVLIQRSTFILNKVGIKTVIGDIVILRSKVFSYIGIVESIEDKDYYTEVKTLDFREIFDVQIPVYSYSGDLVSYLYDLIVTNYKNSTDSKQNLSYLSVIKEASIDGTIYYEDDKIETLSNVLELLSKAYGIGFRFDVDYLRGRIVGITLRIVHVKSGMRIKSDLKSISNLVINDSSSQLTNKLVYYPKSDNELYTSIECFYLLKDGSIIQDESCDSRYTTVMSKSCFYTDNDYDALLTKARSEMATSNLDHNISFTMDLDNMIVRLFDNINLGDYISFYHSKKEYETLLTGIKFKNSMNYAEITLGEYRMKLTEKIQLLTKNIIKSSNSVTVTNSNLDGGEF